MKEKFSEPTLMVPLVPLIVAIFSYSLNELVLIFATPPLENLISTSVSTSTPSSLSFPVALIDVGSSRRAKSAIWIAQTPRSRTVPPPRAFVLENFEEFKLFINMFYNFELFKQKLVYNSIKKFIIFCNKLNFFWRNLYFLKDLLYKVR